MRNIEVAALDIGLKFVTTVAAHAGWHRALKSPTLSSAELADLRKPIVAYICKKNFSRPGILADHVADHSGSGRPIIAAHNY
ncbi:MAG: hypothetical protein M3169_08140 [Candidatus Eremiobacteraeota bacterium]|nr:hypothetical protein [Candidatus Eremiobacteraeota bacterium]